MNNIIKIPIQNKPELLKMYIKQFKHGGLFISGSYAYQLGEEVFLLVALPENAETLAVTGKVAWISPESSVGYTPGIGIHFNNDKAGVDAKNRIEVMLGGLLAGKVASYTF